MKHYGLVGKTLAHSYSKQYFDTRFVNARLVDCRYDLFELSNIGDIRSFLIDHSDIVGFNVTIPYKQSIMPYIDEVAPVAEAVGAVNCVSVTRVRGMLRLKGYNTDVEGFCESLAGESLPCPALILGTGGAAAAVAFALRQAGIEYKFVSRRDNGHCLTYSGLTDEIIRMHPFIVNCTPTGMFPDVDAMPELPYGALTSRHFLYDLIYNPPLTRFLSKGLQQHTHIRNGLDMLHLQANASWRVFGLPS